MPRKRSPNRDQAWEMFKKSGGKIENRRIAEHLGEDEKLVATWKHRDKWLERLNDVHQSSNDVHQTQKNKSAVSKKKNLHLNTDKNETSETVKNSKTKTNSQNPKARPGNKNAVGNRGGTGAPPMNKNALKYGEFVSVFFTPDIIDETERAIIEMDFDIYAHQLILIDTLKIREKRILQEMQQIKDTPGGMLIESVTKEKGTTDFTYKKRDKDGKARDGDGSTEVIDKATHAAVSEAERRLKLGEALTRVQGRLQKALEVWHKMQMDFERLEIDREKLELHRQRITGQIDLEELLDGDDFGLGD